MIDLGNNLIRSFGLLNSACKKANVIWQIVKYPEEDKYSALLTPIEGDTGADLIKADYCDDLIERMIEQAEVIACSN